MNHFRDEFETNEISIDEFIGFRRVSYEPILNWVLPILKKQEDRKRARKERDQQAYELTILLILANSLSAYARSEKTRVHYSRRLQTYCNDSAYYPWFLRSRMLRAVIDSLVRAGLLDGRLGRKDTLTGDGYQSSFCATNDLISALSRLGFDSSHLEVNWWEAPTIILRDVDGRRIEYDPDGRISMMIDEVRSYNEFLAMQNLDIDIEQDRWKELQAKGSVFGSKDWYLSQRRRLYRVFSRGEWNLHGRFYGGFWQTLPKELRSRIRIDQKPIVELDYSGFMVRAIYHELLMQYDGDPYELEDVKLAAQNQGLDWSKVRDKGIKKLLVSLINAEPQTRLDRIQGVILPRGSEFTKRKILEKLEQKHTAISSRFRTGYGLRMMFRESTICQMVLNSAVRDDVAVLPIHDSFITDQDHRDWLWSEMWDAYYYQLSRAPVIKEKTAPDLKMETIRVPVSGPCPNQMIQLKAIHRSIRKLAPVEKWT